LFIQRIHSEFKKIWNCFRFFDENNRLRNVQLCSQIPANGRCLELHDSRIGSFGQTGDGPRGKRVQQFWQKYESRTHHCSDAKGNIKGLKFFCEKMESWEDADFIKDFLKM
jgi:hypothetical protein